MARQVNSRQSQRESSSRPMRGATPAQRSRYLDDNDRLVAPTLIRYTTEPFSSQLPTVDKLVNLDNIQLSNILDRFGVTEPWAKLRAEAVGYLNRMTNYPAGSTQYKTELNKLLDFDSKTGLMKAVKTAYREYQYGLSDPKAIFTRVCENNKSTCDVCADLAGEEGTLDYHRKIGMPGVQSCLGGASCNCELVETE